MLLSSVHAHRPKSQSSIASVVIKDFPTAFLETELEEELSTGGYVKVHRFRHITKKTPLPVISITASSSRVAKWITSGIIISNVICRVEPKKRTKFIRCYKCQRFGHIAKLCKLEERCVKCGTKHNEETRCITKCANCSGDHAADSRICPTFIDESHYPAEEYRWIRT